MRSGFQLVFVEEKEEKWYILENLVLLGLLLLDVLVGAVANQTANEDDGVETEAEASVDLGVGGLDRAGGGRLGLGVGGLIQHVSTRVVRAQWLSWPFGIASTYSALENSDLELLKGLAGLVAVADILKGLGGVLATNVKEDLLTAAVVVGTSCQP